MLKLEEIAAGMQVVGLVPNEVASIIAVVPAGQNAVTLYYKTPTKPVAEQIIYRDKEPELSKASHGLAWSFDSPSADFRMALEAIRIKLGYLFDPMMAVHSSNVIPLPHQISAVYDNMLPKSPLRYVLADDPGAGKTIMAGLLIKELVMRGDAKRILIVSPGSLVDQWQSELQEKFTLDFKIFSRELQEESSSGNFFIDEDFVVARIDQLARAEDVQDKLAQTEWDLVIIDEAHKLSAHWFGRELKKTQRYQLGELLGRISRHILLMTATPHNGKDDDFQLWLQLLDPDRFFGLKGDQNGRVTVDESVMRRMVKEKLLKFDGTRLFPKRIASTVKYELSPLEHELYLAVTNYVVEEMNKADRLAGKARNCVGFALTMLQRRLASSPEAIYLSLKRRHERLLARIDDVRAGRATDVAMPEFGEEFDEDDFTPEELERMANKILDAQTAAQSLPELEEEVKMLGALVSQAKAILDSGHDAKWDRLSELLQSGEMHDAAGHRRKLIIFTEHRDTLDYLAKRIRGVVGDARVVVAIHGGTNREARRQVQEEFNNNPDVQVLLATDAAGEGVNLHRNCNLMVNYDMPWNPCRLEQRFGRIHRIGQTETCHLWNLVATDTREGQVFERLLEKLEEESRALGGQVFDILGLAFEEVSLKDMLLKAIRDGMSEESKNWMKVKVDTVLDVNHLKDIISRNSLAGNTIMTPDMVYRVKDEMERAEARKLQPCFVRSFFLEGLRRFGGDARARQKGRWEIPHVPPRIVSAAKSLNSRRPVATRYNYICFDKDLIRPDGMQPAEFLHAGHPLVAAVTKLVLEDTEKYLKPGTVMIDPGDEGTTPYLLFMIDHSVVAGPKRNVLSRRLQFVRMDKDGTFSYAGWAPHLDLEVATPEAQQIAAAECNEPWLSGNLEQLASDYATDKVVAAHYTEIKSRQLDKMRKMQEGIHAQLVKAISFYQTKYVAFDAEARGATPSPTAAANAEKMRRKAEELANRLREREKEIDEQRNVISLAPVVQGGILVIPKGMLGCTSSTNTAQQSADPEARKRVEMLAMQAVAQAEQALGNTVIDVSAEKCGWDLTSRFPKPADGSPMRDDRHIEVKGRAKDADKVTMTRNEICYAINQRDKFILALVLVDGDKTEGPYYIRNIWENELNFGVAQEEYAIADLLSKAVKPEETL